MASQRHKREHNFLRVPHPASSTPGDTVGPKPPIDSADEKANSDYNEVAAWPDGDRPSVVPTV
jgi:hypothetical protein